MRPLFRYPTFPYTSDFQVLFLVSQKSVLRNKSNSLSPNCSRSTFCKAFFLKHFVFLIKFCSSSVSNDEMVFHVESPNSRAACGTFHWAIHYLFASLSSTLGVITLTNVLLNACATIVHSYTGF